MGGQGYDGKVFAHYGECGDGNVQLKSLVRAEDGGFVSLREDCQDLPQPVPVASSSLRTSAYDASILGVGGNVYDSFAGDLPEFKLTTAFCHSDESPAVEVEIWYKSDVFSAFPDPRLATELFGTVTTADGWSTGVVSVAPPVVFTDRLVYDAAAGIELIESRDGVSSRLKFIRNGNRAELKVQCHQQAAPKYLEAAAGYFLKLSPTVANGGSEFGLISHQVEKNLDLFKQLDSSLPSADANSLNGWNAGFVSIEGKVYEMRKTADGQICFGPGEDPRSPCVMSVLGKVNSDAFATTYETLRTQALARSRLLNRFHDQLNMEKPLVPGIARLIATYYSECGASAPFPSQLNWRTAGDALSVSSRMLNYLNDGSAHSRFKQSIVDASHALIEQMPKDVFTTPATACTGRKDMYTANRVLTGLYRAYFATEDPEIREFLNRQLGNVKAQAAAVQSALEGVEKAFNFSYGKYSINELSHLAGILMAYDELGLAPLNRTFWFARFNLIFDLQIRSVAQIAKCPNSENTKFGGWTVINSNCYESPSKSSNLMIATAQLYGWLGRPANADKPAAKALRLRAKEVVLGRLAYLYNHLSEGPLDTGPKLTNFIRLIGYANSFGIHDDESIQIGFDAMDRVKLAVVKAAYVEQNLKYSMTKDPDRDSGISLSDATFEARLAELLLANP
jgi:hypothetical protein